VKTWYRIMTQRKKKVKKRESKRSHSKNCLQHWSLITVILWDKEIIYSEVYEQPQSKV